MFLNKLLHGGKKIEVALKNNKFRTNILKLNGAGRSSPHRFHSTLLGLAGAKLLSGSSLPSLWPHGADVFLDSPLNIAISWARSPSLFWENVISDPNLNRMDGYHWFDLK